MTTPIENVAEFQVRGAFYIARQFMESSNVDVIIDTFEPVSLLQDSEDGIHTMQIEIPLKVMEEIRTEAGFFDSPFVLTLRLSLILCESILRDEGD